MYKKLFSALFLLIPGFTLFIANNSVYAMTVDGFTIKKGIFLLRIQQAVLD